MTQLTEQFLQHPLSAAFPAMPGHEVDALAQDIKSHGQREPGVMYEGMVLDGWHRSRACAIAAMPFNYVELAAYEDPVAFVKSRNLHRRHLTGSQRADAVIACSNWATSGRPENRAPGARLSTNAEMAREADVGERTIKDAKVARSAGLGDAVRDGKVSAKRAAEIAKADPKIAKKIASGKVTEAAAFERPRFSTASSAGVEATRVAGNAASDPASLRTQIERLTAELQESRENAVELADSLEAYLIVDEGVEATAKEIKRLTGQLRVVEGQRDQYMTKANVLLEQVDSLVRQVKRLERKLEAASEVTS